MEKRKKTAVESGVLILIVAAILVAVNALSALGVYKRKDVDQDREVHAVEGQREPAPLDEAEAHGRRLRHARPAEARRLRPRPARPPPGVQERGRRQVRLHASSSRRTRTRRRRRRTPASSSSRSARRATPDEKAAVAQGFMGLVFKYGEQQDVIKFLPPERTDGLEFWITNKIREIRDKGDDIQHKIGVLTGHDEMKLTDNNLVPSQMGKYSMQSDHHAELPLLHVPGRRPEGRRRGDRRRPRRPASSRSRARTSPRRSSGASTSS